MNTTPILAEMATRRAAEKVQEAAELAALRRDNEIFSEQLKQLVRTEGTLYQYQEQLDAQLAEYQELYRLNRKLSANLELATIFAHASDFIINNLGYERVVFFRYREESRDYAVAALDGYYDEEEKAEVSRLEMAGEDPAISALFHGEEYLIASGLGQHPQLARLGQSMKLGEYLLYPLGAHPHPAALLAVGNSVENASFNRRVVDSQSALAGIGNLAGLVSSSIDNQILYASMRRALEQEQRAEAKYRGLFENATEGIFRTKPDGSFVNCNPALAEILGYDTPAELMASVNDLGRQHYVDQQQRQTLVAEMSSGKTIKGFEVECYRKDHSRRWVRLSARPYLGQQGELLYLDGMIEDITERKQAEGALQKLNEELEQRVAERTLELEGANLDLRHLSAELETANRDLKLTQSCMLQQEKMASIGQLAAGVAHEINNPIGFIISNLNTLGKYTEKLASFTALQSAALNELAPQGDPEVIRALQDKRRALKIDYVLDDLDHLVGECLEGAERVKKIVQELKTFSRVDHSEARAANLNEGLESTINIAWNELKFKAELKREYGEIPPIRCNPGQLNQVFMNLLVNAAHAIEVKGVIGVRTLSDDRFVYVTISDTGSGIPADKINRIFEPFYTTKEAGKGTGLGLSIVYDIVKKHGGEIKVESEVGKGTAFTVILPLAGAVAPGE